MRSSKPETRAGASRAAPDQRTAIIALPIRGRPDCAIPTSCVGASAAILQGVNFGRRQGVNFGRRLTGGVPARNQKAIGRQSAWAFGGSDWCRVLPWALACQCLWRRAHSPSRAKSGAAWCHISRSCLACSIIREPRMPSPHRCGYPRATRQLFAHQGSVLILGFGEPLRFRNSPHITACLGSVAWRAQGL